jgi:uncharacterized protein (TIGR02284 family)
MSILREEREIALTDVVLALKDAALQLEDEAVVLKESPAAALFRELAVEHRAMAAELDAELRRLGYKTREPDPDAETGKELLTRVKAALASDEARTLVQEREAGEEAAGDAIDAARLLANLEPETRALLDRLADRVATARSRLARTSPVSD